MGRRWIRATALVIACALTWGSALPAGAVIIDTGDGTGNTTPPADDPGFDNVVLRPPLTAVYLGNRWVITATHIPTGDIVVNGVSYDYIPGSRVVLTQPGTSTIVDLQVYRVYGDPGLPSLEIASSPPGFNKSVTLAGNGKNRGDATSFGGYDGWAYGLYNTIRWGTNKVSHTSLTSGTTQAFGMYFDYIQNPQAGTHESVAATGDSGGGVFGKTAGTWYLYGVMIGVTSHSGQPPNTALYQNITFAADLSEYRSQILALVDQSSCSDGLDDDADGLADYPADPGCTDAFDASERDSGLICDDGLDNDGDGLIDYPADPQCSNPLDTLEASECGDGVDNDGDGLTDAGADPGCTDAFDLSEREAGLICDDGLDNDGDGLIDHPEDPHCIQPTTPTEAPNPLSALGPLSTLALATALPALGSLALRLRRS